MKTAERLLHQLNTAVLWLDSQLQIRYLNAAAEALLGVSARRALNVSIHHFITDLESSPLQKLQMALETGHPFSQREAKVRLANQQSITIDYMVSHLTDEKNQSSLILEMLPRDRLLQISREEALLAKSVTTRALVRGLAHEIKNPLGGIRGAAQLLQKAMLNWDSPKDELNEDLTEFTNVIISEVDRLRDLVDKLLGPSRPPRKDFVNIHEILEYVRHLVMAEGFPGVSVVTDYDPSIPELLLDRNQMIQVILNLIKNALQALHQASTPEATLTLKTRTVAQYTIGTQRYPLVLKVEILDNGPGIPTAIQDTLFYPMVSGRPDGTGLGLAIAQSIVNQHRGIIEFESQPGLTRFSVLLPMERQQ